MESPVTARVAGVDAVAGRLVDPRSVSGAADVDADRLDDASRCIDGCADESSMAVSGSVSLKSKSVMCKGSGSLNTNECTLPVSGLAQVGHGAHAAKIPHIESSAYNIAHDIGVNTHQSQGSARNRYHRYAAETSHHQSQGSARNRYHRYAAEASNAKTNQVPQETMLCISKSQVMRLPVAFSVVQRQNIQYPPQQRNTYRESLVQIVQ